MGDFEVQIDELNTAAGHARDAADEVGAVDLASALTGIGTAMPGSDSAGRATELGTSWTEERNTLSGTLEEFADGLESAARLYSSNDEAAAAAFG